MKFKKSAVLSAVMSLLCIFSLKAVAETSVRLTDSVSISFHQSKWHLDRNLNNNGSALDSIDRRLTSVLGDSIWQLKHVSVVGGASPEGTEKFNRFLSEQRAATLFDYFKKYRSLTDSDVTHVFLGRDWGGVLRLAEADEKLPYRAETLRVLGEIAAEKLLSGKEPAGSLEKIKALRGGVPYRYLYKNIFPKVRASKVMVDYERVILPEHAEKKQESLPIPETSVVVEVVPAEQFEVIPVDTVQSVSDSECRPFYMDIQTNMLFDLLALPNIGVEFYVGQNISLGANWLYAWWSKNSVHRFWRAYGGDIYARWWFGKEAARKPLTGHHLGIFTNIYTYDFEFGGKGEMGGKPGGNLWDQSLRSFGVEYGYSLPIASGLNLDFSLALGYSGGKYHKYRPIDDHYVWQSTHNRHYFGPTKLAVSLVWLLGCGNVNRN